jgi:hypothetical protein
MEAHTFCIDMIKDHGDDWSKTFSWDYKTYSAEENCFHAGFSADIEVSIHPGFFHHSGWQGKTGWNSSGTALVSKDEAMDLGSYDEPVGFVANESEEGIWIRETRTHEELNQDLHDYFRLGEIEEEHAGICNDWIQ